MAWKTEDVKNFKKGLSDKGEEQWVFIANTTLKECEEAGEKDCVTKAIQKANGMVANAKLIDYFKNSQKEYEVRYEDHQGRPHIVVPVIMMVEGVHEGSAGPVYHKADELGKVPGSWNGMPVVVNHPQKDGRFVSANLPDVIDQEIVGRVYNSEMDGDKLRGEVWLDKERLEKISPQAFEFINDGLPLDVSIGVFTEDDYVTGDWNGEKYNAIARNHRPDHLALLPGGEGACSWDDGCGVRVNTKLNENQSKMSKKCCPEKVAALILNESSKFTEDDREWLEEQEEAVIDKLIPEPKVNKTEVTDEKVIEVLSKKAKEDPNSFYELLPEDMRESVKTGISLHKEQRTNIVKDIMANTKDVWTEDVLNGMDFDTLSRIHKSVDVVTDYSPAGGPPSASDEVLYPTGVKVENK